MQCSTIYDDETRTKCNTMAIKTTQKTNRQNRAKNGTKKHSRDSLDEYGSFMSTTDGINRENETNNYRLAKRTETSSTITFGTGFAV